MSNVLTKKCLVQALKKKYGRKYHLDNTEFVNQFFHEISEAITDSSQGEVKLSGLGKFTVREKSPRTGMNFSTGEKITIEGRKTVVFTSSRNLKKQVGLLGQETKLEVSAVEQEKKSEIPE